MKFRIILKWFLNKCWFVAVENHSFYFKSHQSRNPPCLCEKRVIKRGDFNKIDPCDENEFTAIGKIDKNYTSQVTGYKLYNCIMQLALYYVITSWWSKIVPIVFQGYFHPGKLSFLIWEVFLESLFPTKFNFFIPFDGNNRGWRRNVLVKTWSSWWPFWPFWSTTSTFFLF